MPQFFMNKRLILLLAGVIVLVALIGFSLRDDREMTLPEQFLKDTVGLFQTVVHVPAQYVAGFFESVNDLKNTYSENQLLRERLDEQLVLEAKVQELEKENTELKAIIEQEESLSDYNPIIASVIGRNPDRWYDLVIINKGASAGIEQDMAVMTSAGLIGKVKSVNPGSATVQLLSAPDRKNRISAEVQGENNEPNIFGLIEGYDKEKGALLLRRIETTENVEIGQKVITSGQGGLFPSGLLIGEVIDVQPDSFGLTKMAYVKPAADSYDLNRVIVVDREAEVVDVGDSSENEEENE